MFKVCFKCLKKKKNLQKENRERNTNSFLENTCPLPAPRQPLLDKQHERAHNDLPPAAPGGRLSICSRDTGAPAESALAACQPSDSRFLLTRLSINGQMASALLAAECS